jgi:hypothetical protein
MKDLLLKYLLQYQQLGLQGIGFLQLYIRASQTDIVNRRILPPTPAFQFSSDVPVPAEKDQIRYIARKLQTSEDAAEQQLEDFCTSTLEGLKKGIPLVWDGFGTIRKGIAGDMMFELASKTIFAFPPVSAERVIRTHQEHTIQVGDTEKTNFEMEELLHEQEPPRASRWWVWAVVLALIGLGVIGFYVYQHNGLVGGFRNQEALPQNTP